MFARHAGLTAFAACLFAPDSSAQLQHRYSFNGTGMTVTDSIGGADGTIMGGAAMAAGEIVLDGIDDYVELPGGLASASEARSFEVWFNWSSASNWQRLLDCGDNNGSSGLTYFVISPQGSNGQSVGAIKTVNPGASAKVYSLSPTNLGTLTHVCVTYDSAGDVFKIYLDGAFQAETTITENLSELNDVNCWIGRSQFISDPYYSGSITELRIHEGVLSDTEVAASFASGPDQLPSVGTSFCSPANANSTGAGATMGTSGSNVVANNDLVLEASDLPANAFGFFLTSMTQGLVMNPGGSQGNLCLGGSIGRYVGAGQIQNSGAGGMISLAVDQTQHPTPTGLVSVAPGETWNFQAWYRDSVMGNATSNFSDGLEITFQ